MGIELGVGLDRLLKRHIRTFPAESIGSFDLLLEPWTGRGYGCLLLRGTASQKKQAEEEIPSGHLWPMIMQLTPNGNSPSEGGFRPDDAAKIYFTRHAFKKALAGGGPRFEKGKGSGAKEDPSPASSINLL